jgi:hypothetical protein
MTPMRPLLPLALLLTAALPSAAPAARRPRRKAAPLTAAERAKLRTAFTQLLFLPDLQIRTREPYKDGATLYVVPRGRQSKQWVRIPSAGTIPTIGITALNRDFRAAETELSRFITALQRGDREKAAGFLSSRVPDAERRALVQGSWLPRPTRVRKSGYLEVEMRKEAGSWRVMMHPNTQAG